MKSGTEERRVRGSLLLLMPLLLVATAASSQAPAPDDASASAAAGGAASLEVAQAAALDPDEEGPRTPVAEHVDLSEPLYDPAKGRSESTEVSAPGRDRAEELPPEPGRAPLVLLGESVQPATAVRLSWALDNRFEGIAVPTPVLVVHGRTEGPTVCLTAAVHGDELNGIEIVRRVLYDLDPAVLRGTVIGVPIVNLPSFRRGSRYLPDRRDLNRYFPGSESGSAASRIAHSFFHDVVAFCDALVDIHTGSLHRSNLPQLRADMRVVDVAALTEKFGATAVLHSIGAEGTLRRAAVDAGIPAVTLETGEPYRLHEDDIAHGTKGIQSLLNRLEMQPHVSIWGDPEPVYYQSIWVRADRGGLLFGEVDLGQKVKKGDILGIVSDPITNLRSELRAPRAGRVLGKALNQVVMPGFAAFRIGIPTTESELSRPGPNPALQLPLDQPAVGDEDENS